MHRSAVYTFKAIFAMEPEIAETLGVSVKTVEFHKQKLTEKLGIHTDAALTAYAIRHGISSTE